MRRVLITILLASLAAALLPLASGCAASEGAYFHRTRISMPHPFRNRIHNPADFRY